VETYDIYFAGSLFNIRELTGNVLLSKSIDEYSGGRYRCILPQDLEQRKKTAKSIRDQDIKAVLEADFILANYDGTELDSGTVVEFMVAKFADIPAVLLRTDFRSGGDAKDGDPWNLMSSFYPRTIPLVINGMSYYKDFGYDASNWNTSIGVIHAMEHLLQEKPPITKDLGIQTSIYNWLNTTVGFEEPYTREELDAIIKRKREKGLL